VFLSLMLLLLSPILRSLFLSSPGSTSRASRTCRWTLAMTAGGYTVEEHVGAVVIIIFIALLLHLAPRFSFFSRTLFFFSSLQLFLLKEWSNLSLSMTRDVGDRRQVRREVRTVTCFSRREVKPAHRMADDIFPRWFRFIKSSGHVISIGVTWSPVMP
jgi:hypothetical protein